MIYVLAENLGVAARFADNRKWPLPDWVFVPIERQKHLLSVEPPDEVAIAATRLRDDTAMRLRTVLSYHGVPERH